MSGKGKLMINLPALKAFRAQVAVGAFDFDGPYEFKHSKFSALRDACEGAFGPNPRLRVPLWNAYMGSLSDAACLHNAWLPGWEYGVTKNQEMGTCAFVAPWGCGGEGDGFEAQGYIPARAWFIAMLDALIAKEEGKSDD